MRTKFLLTVLVSCGLTAILTAIIVKRQYEEPDDPHVSAGVVQSSILAERRDLIISLPESYQRETARRYPVLYVLDGSSHAAHTAASARLMARIGVMPEIIVVGIPSSRENRDRDYTPPTMHGGADRFLRFLERELIPHVEKTYRATSTRMLAGHSRGGLFVMYSLLARPDLFSARFAYSPALWHNDDRIIAEMAKSLKSLTAAPGFLYLSLGDGENEKMTRAFRRPWA